MMKNEFEKKKNRNVKFSLNFNKVPIFAPKFKEYVECPLIM